MKKKPAKQKTDSELAAEKLSKSTVDSINGWKAIALTELHCEHPLAWRHGAEMVEAVCELEEAYLTIIATMERHFDEYEHYEGKSPSNN